MEADLEAELDPGFSGAVLLRASGQRSLVVRGSADLEAHFTITRLTRFNIASLTKLLTAVAVCRLVERGTLGLRQSVAELLPGSGIPRAPEIRIEHLLSHTAGFPEEAPETGIDDVLGDHWVAAARTRLLFDPGTSWAYSNIGYGVLGAVMERVAGQPFAETVEDLVLVPAGMTETRLRDERPDRSAIGYVGRTAERDVDSRSDDNWREAELVGRPKPYGYAWSTVEDLERLAYAVASGALVGWTLIDRILRGKVETGQPGRLAGFGMFHELIAGRSIATISGAGPGVSAWLDVVAEPEASYLAIVLSNRPKPAAHLVGERLRRRHLDPSCLGRQVRSQPGALSGEGPCS